MSTNTATAPIQLSAETRQRLSIDSGLICEALNGGPCEPWQAAAAARANAILCLTQYPDSAAVAVSMRTLRGEYGIPECETPELSLLACGALV